MSDSLAFEKSTVKISSSTPGWNLDAWQYVPSHHPKPHPVIIMANGLGCNKLMGLADYAEQFVSAGYACVVFDYRRWGASDGYPRNALFVSEQLDDYRTVIKYCRQQNGPFDPQRVILWGFSFSGGHTTTLAAENNLNIFAGIALSPDVGNLSFPFQWRIPYFVRLFLGVADFIKQNLGLAPVYVPTSALPGQIGQLTQPGAVEGFAKVVKPESNFPNQISASAFFRVPLYRPRTTAPKISCPILLIAPQQDNICSYQRTLDVGETMPTAEVLKVTGGHFDMFKGQVDYETSSATQLSFLAKHVPL